MKTYITYPHGCESSKDKFIQDNPSLGDLISFEYMDEQTITEALLMRNKMSVDGGFDKISKSQISELLAHRGLWWECYSSREPVAIINCDTKVLSNYSAEGFTKILKETDIDIIDLSAGGCSFSGGYIISPSGAEKLMATIMLSKITSIDSYFEVMRHHMSVYSEDVYIEYKTSRNISSSVGERNKPERKHKIKYYILTSDNPEALERHISPEYSNIPKEDIVIVINTLDKKYSEYVVEWCEKNSIEYHITHSNGTPARGKNTLIDLFLKSDNDYMVQVDGDDYLTEHGVWVYDHLSRIDNPPDVVCLKNQLSTILDREYLIENKINPYVLPLEDIPVLKSLYFTADWKSIEEYDVVPDFINNGCSESDAKIFAEYHKEFYRLQKLYCEDNESHCRVTWLSKKAASRHKFPEHLVVGEDTIFYFNLKHDGLNGDLDVRCNDERPPTYVYDQRTPGTVHREVKEGTDWTWMSKYNNEVRYLEQSGIVHTEDLPLLNIDYPNDYQLHHSCIGSEGSLFEFNYGELNGSFKAPLNASEESLKEMFDWLYKYYK